MKKKYELARTIHGDEQTLKAIAAEYPECVDSIWSFKGDNDKITWIQEPHKKYKTITGRLHLNGINQLTLFITIEKFERLIKNYHLTEMKTKSHRDWAL